MVARITQSTRINSYFYPTMSRMNYTTTTDSLISFDNTEIAFAYKDNAALKRAYRLFKMISNPWLSSTGATAAQLALKAGLPVKGIIRSTLYAQFCGGETVEKSLPTINELAASQVMTVLDYGVEAKDTEADFDRTLAEMKHEIQFAKDHSHVLCISCKLTGLARFALLEKMQANKPLRPEEEAEWERAQARVDEISAFAKQHDVALYIDAEETWIQAPIDDLVTKMMEKYNREKAIIFNTLQLYRHDRLAHLKNAVAAAESGGYYYGVKLVRGAYMEKERERAQRLGYADPIQATKIDTDRDFNAAVVFCVDHIERVAVCVATHNEESNLLFARLIEERGIDKQHPHAFSCQLLGMSDHITFNMANAGFRTGKYIPYGPVKDVVPYLSRRAKENTSVGGQMSRELQLLKREMHRRRLI